VNEDLLEPYPDDVTGMTFRVFEEERQNVRHK